MIKNGLFLCSIGFLIILYSLNPTSLQYDIRSLTTGLILVISGGYFFIKGNKKNQKTKDGMEK